MKKVLSNLRVGKDFLRCRKKKFLKRKINKLDFIKITAFLLFNRLCQENELQATDRRKYSVKGLVSRIKKKIKTTHLKYGENTQPYFPEEDIQMTNKHMKRYSASLVIREMQFKTISVTINS